MRLQVSGKKKNPLSLKPRFPLIIRNAWISSECAGCSRKEERGSALRIMPLLKEEKTALQDILEMAEGEEANTREAYRTLKMDYARRLKKLAPVKKI